MDSLIANGEILKSTAYVPFRSEDSVLLAQKIWFGHGGIPLFSKNIEVVKQQLEVLQSPVPALFDNEKEFYKITKRLLNRLRCFRSGIINLHIFAAGSETNFLITVEAFDEFDFPLSKQGIMIGFAEQVKFSKNPLARHAFYNTPLWKTTAGAENSACKNMVFLNENGSVTDCMGANIFGVKKGEIITPATETGCYSDVLRELIIDASIEIQLKINETTKLKKEDLLLMDEIFLASEATGIEWIMGIGNKRFVHSVSGKVQARLNEDLKEMAR